MPQTSQHTRIHQLFDARAAQAPDHPFLFLTDGVITLGQLASQVDALETELRETGVRLGDRVYLSIAGRVVGPLVSVDCQQAKHRQTATRPLVADVPAELWRKLHLPNAPQPCEVWAEAVPRRPQGRGEEP